MPLRLTRMTGEILYGGDELDPNDLEGSYDHRVLLRRVRYQKYDSDALVAVAVANVKSHEGVSEHLLVAGDEGIYLRKDVHISIQFLSTRSIERNGLTTEIPQASLVISAPTSYALLRDNAKDGNKLQV